MKCDISKDLKVTRSGLHIIVPLIKKHYYSHPQYQTIDFVFIDTTKIELSQFKLKVNVMRDTPWTYDLSQKIHNADLSYLFFLAGQHL